MRSWRSAARIALWSLVAASPSLALQEVPGSIRGVVHDRDFDLPLPAARVAVIGGPEVLSSEEGNYLINGVPPGTYTLVFSKDGYTRQVRAGVLVRAGQLTEVDASLGGDFTDLDEFVVQDLLLLGGGSEVALLELRLDSPALVDSIGSELMGRAGSSDAAEALRLVTGASLQDGKSAVIRGLPDRFVSSQLNGVRLPTADEDKRAVELDQFPASVIESLRVSKTFTPDQQGDASGGAVDIRLRGIPQTTTFDFRVQGSRNSNVTDAGEDFLGYEGGGVDRWGDGAQDRAPQLDRLGENWEGAVGSTPAGAPNDSKWSVSGGHRHALDEDWTIGGYASFFYERDSSYHDDGVRDSYWVTRQRGPMVPQTSQGVPENGDFRTNLFDITQAAESVQWGGLGALGIESKDHSLTLSYLYSRTAEDKVTVAEDTRGKSYFFPGYDVDDPRAEGNRTTNRDAAPWIRTEALEYTERTTQSLILDGSHRLPLGKLRVSDSFAFDAPELEWFYADSKATLDQPDKRLFSAIWYAPSFIPGIPGLLPDTKVPAEWRPYRPAASFTLGNLQRIFKEIDESSDQYGVDLKFPFQQWTGDRGYLKFGIYDENLDRTFTQDTYTNAGETGFYTGSWNQGWAQNWSGPAQDIAGGSRDHPIDEALSDVDYAGDQRISAWYGMADIPLVSSVRLVGGARVESTDIEVVVTPEELSTWYPPDAPGVFELLPGDADVDFSQEDVLPAVGLVYEPIEKVVLRASYGETVARQTFKELTPVLQQEFVGGPIFIGNPELGMASLSNYDLRFDYTPYTGSLVSVSWFRKNVTDPIEYVQRLVGFEFTTAVNFPTGVLQGWELELRQSLGRLAPALEGFAVGANATFIDSTVTLSEDQQAEFTHPNVNAPQTERPMTNAPEHLYNLYLTWDIESTGTQFGLFYTIQGDTLLAGAATSDFNFVPDVYATQFDTLNFSFVQRLGKHFRLQFQAKNLTDPLIQSVYRSEYIEQDVLHTSFSRGIETSISLGASFSF